MEYSNAIDMLKKRDSKKIDNNTYFGIEIDNTGNVISEIKQAKETVKELIDYFLITALAAILTAVFIMLAITILL